MKRFLIILLMIGIIGCVAYADINRSIGDYNTSADWTIANVTLSSTTEIGLITLEAGSVVAYKLKSNTGYVKFLASDSTGAAYITLGSYESFSPAIPTPLAKDTTFYFLATDVTTPRVVELWYSYR